MLWSNTETTSILSIIARGARNATKDEVELLLRTARARKDPALDDASRNAQVRYLGRQKAVLKAALKDQFPNTAVPMPTAAINWLKLFARLDAGVYVVPPDRFLEDAEGNRIDSEDKRAKLWEWALKKSKLHVVMAEAERRALITPGSGIGHVSWVKPPGDEDGYPTISLYWPHDVEALCHWSAPTSWAHRYVVALRQATPDMGSKADWFRVFSRTPPIGVTGQWGGWQSVLVSTEGEHATESAEDMSYPGEVCPVFLVQLQEPEGHHPFALSDTDLIDAVDDLNVRRSNEAFVTYMQGHDQMWTNDPKGIGSQKVGPDAMLTVLDGSTVGVLSMNPKISDMQTSCEQALRQLATSRGNSPHAYVTKAGGPPQSGVAMRIENLAHDNRVADQATTMQAIEESDALPIILDVVRTFHPDGHILDGCVPRMIPRKQPTFEEPRQKQDRLFQAVDKKAISLARAAADMEFYPTVDDAQKALISISGGVEDDAGDDTVLPTPTDADASTTVQDTALNGAQVSSLLEIVQAVTAGAIPKSTAQAMIAAAFPGIDAAQVNAIMGPVTEGSAEVSGPPGTSQI